uniref:HEAT repeat-containing protein 1 n=1 Tax=Ditylenchus dipsaci TaxID=166011 RepID=A0A915EX04_9BILA
MESSSSRTLLSNLLPKLTKPPVNSLALSDWAAVAEDSLSRNLPKIMDALLSTHINTTVESMSRTQFQPMTEMLEVLLPGLVMLYNLEDPIVVENSIEAMNCLVKQLDSTTIWI